MSTNVEIYYLITWKINVRKIALGRCGNFIHHEGGVYYEEKSSYTLDVIRRWCTGKGREVTYEKG